MLAFHLHLAVILRVLKARWNQLREHLAANAVLWPACALLATMMLVLSAVVLVHASGTPAAPAREITSPAAVPAKSHARYRSHIVTVIITPGESLFAIAQRYFDHGYRWPRIYTATMTQVTTPVHIYPGEVLKFALRRR
jgi:LysM domain